MPLQISGDGLAGRAVGGPATRRSPRVRPATSATAYPPSSRFGQVAPLGPRRKAQSPIAARAVRRRGRRVRPLWWRRCPRIRRRRDDRSLSRAGRRRSPPRPAAGRRRRAAADPAPDAARLPGLRHARRRRGLARGRHPDAPDRPAAGSDGALGRPDSPAHRQQVRGSSCDAGGAPPWWKTAVFYQIYPRSFALGDPSGRRARLATAGAAYDALTRRRRRSRGDPPEARLPRLARGRRDSGSRRSNLRRWPTSATTSPTTATSTPSSGRSTTSTGSSPRPTPRGLRLIMDWVPNHTSDRHPWFVDARSSRTAAHRDWYLWRDGRGPGGAEPPNNWARAFGDGSGLDLRRDHASSGTCTCSCPSSPISTGPTRRWCRRWRA